MASRWTLHSGLLASISEKLAFGGRLGGVRVLNCGGTSSGCRRCSRTATSYARLRSYQASYHTLFVNGDANPDAVWFYPDPKEAAANIKGRVAFWKGVQVVE